MKDKITRRRFIKSLAVGAVAATLPACRPTPRRSDKPNFIIIFCDDLGYGDLGCFGSKLHRTPNLDRMAEQGTMFTSFYVTSSVCTPSRASLMTGCYPKRVDMHQDSHGKCVLFPVENKGLNPNEITIAEILKQQGYATCCIGKWHLGDQPPFLPTRHGFDYYFGIPYSNDMGTRKGTSNPPLPLMQNEKVIEAPVLQDTLTKRYTEEAIKFIKKNKDRPFFLYLPHTMVHNPLNPGSRFRGRSANGLYGDALEEIDFYTGRILGKTCHQIATSMDLLPTFARLAGTQPPTDRIIDGKNIWPLISGQPNAGSPHEAFYYYQIDQLQAVRSGKWKLHLPLKPKKRHWGKPITEAPLALYDLENDIAEKNNLAQHHPNVVKRLLALAEKARSDLGDLDRKGENIRPAGWVQNPKPLLLMPK